MYRKTQPGRIRVYRATGGWKVAGGRDAGLLTYASWSLAYAAAEEWAKRVRQMARWEAWLRDEYPTGIWQPAT